MEWKQDRPVQQSIKKEKCKISFKKRKDGGFNMETSGCSKTELEALSRDKMDSVENE